MCVRKKNFHVSCTWYKSLVSGYTPLHVGAQYAQIKCVKYISDKIIIKNPRDKYQRTPEDVFQQVHGSGYFIFPVSGFKSFKDVLVFSFHTTYLLIQNGKSDWNKKKNLVK